MPETPYQLLTQFDLARKQQAYVNAIKDKIHQAHPDFTDAQVDMVLSGQIGTASTPESSPSIETPAAIPQQRWSVPTTATTQDIPQPIPSTGSGEINGVPIDPNARQVTWHIPPPAPPQAGGTVTQYSPAQMKMLRQQWSIEDKAQAADEKAQEKADASAQEKNSPEGMKEQGEELSSELKKAQDDGSPQFVQDEIQTELNNLGTAFTNRWAIPTGATTENSSAQPIDPNNVQQVQTALSEVPSAVQSKIALATRISQAHPDWTKAQVIEAVNGQLAGAAP